MFTFHRFAPALLCEEEIPRIDKHFILVVCNIDIGIELMYRKACLMESLDWRRESARN